MTTDCTDICEAIADKICLPCKDRKICLDVPEDQSNFHVQLMECIGKTHFIKCGFVGDN
jgi:hypothetical protein